MSHLEVLKEILKIEKRGCEELKLDSEEIKAIKFAINLIEKVDLLKIEKVIMDYQEAGHLLGATKPLSQAIVQYLLGKEEMKIKIRKGGKNKQDKFWCSKHQVVHSLMNQYPTCRYPNNQEASNGK